MGKTVRVTGGKETEVEGVLPPVFLKDGPLLLKNGMEEYLNLRPDSGKFVNKENTPVRPEYTGPGKRQGVGRAHTGGYGLDILETNDLRLIRIFVALDPGKSLLSPYPLYTELLHRIGACATAGAKTALRPRRIIITGTPDYFRHRHQEAGDRTAKPCLSRSFL